MRRFVVAAAILVQQVSAFGFPACDICHQDVSLAATPTDVTFADQDLVNRFKYIYNPDSYNWILCYDFWRAGQLGLIAPDDCDNASQLASTCCGREQADPIPHSVNLAPLWPAFPSCNACTKSLELINPHSLVSVLGATMTCKSLSVGGELG